MPTEAPTKAPTKTPIETPEPDFEPQPMYPERLCPAQKEHITRTVEPLFP